MEDRKEYFLKYLNEYNQSWCDKDIEKINDQWKVLHVHCSFEPEK